LHPDQYAYPALRTQREVAGGERRQKITAIGRLRKQHGTHRCQQLAAEIQFGGAVAVGQEAVIANALEAWRKRML